MKRLLIILPVLFLSFRGMAQEVRVNDSLVEVSGVVMTADSLRYIPGVTIHIKGSDRGTVANDEGVFSLVAKKGDTLVFSVVGFKNNKINIPGWVDGHFYGLAIPMQQDTTYLPPMVVHSYPSKEEFEEAFLHWKIPSNLYDLAKANTTPEKLRDALYYTAPDGGEGVSRTFSSHRRMMETKGEIPTMTIFNPLAWAKFIKALKDGDFKNKD